MAVVDLIRKVIKDNNLNVEVHQFVHDEDMPDKMEIKIDLHSESREALELINSKIVELGVCKDETSPLVPMENSGDDIFVYTYLLWLYEGDCYSKEVESISKYTGKDYSAFSFLEKNDVNWEDMESIYEWGQVF